MTYKKQHRNNLPEIAIISAHKTGLDLSENHLRTNELRKDLDKLALKNCGVVGHFGDEKEINFLIELSEESDLKTVLSLSKQYEQNCILVADKERKSKLLLTNGKEKELGKLTEVTENEAKSLDNYTELPSFVGGKSSFWVAK